MFKTFITLIATALLLTACGESSSNKPAPTTSWLATVPPVESVSIKQAKAQATEGDTISLTGVIGGKLDGGISAESGLFLMVDESIPSCADMADDHCKTPWDYCCEPRENLVAGMATVMVVDADGNPIPLDGLKPLDKVTVSGTVGARPDDKVLTVTAQSVYIESNNTENSGS